MPELPRGTVTLLFTDIDGSTQLLEKLGRAGYVRALTEHRRLLRETFAAYGGVEVEMQGDSFHFAFPSAGGAVVAAAAAQRGLAEHRWEAEPVRVRIGLHTGEPLEADGLYAGLDVHRAARVMSAGHGGQVVMSARTADLVAAELPRGLSLLDLGEHRLKDLSGPQQLYQLVGEGLGAEFPPLRTLTEASHNLPVQATPFLGRQRELVELQQLLARADVRLLTLTGPGGIGKTRLALQAAAESPELFRGGLFAVGLAGLREPALLLPTLLSSLGLREQPGKEPLQTLARRLEGNCSLLLLDNLEQLLPEAAAPLAELLLSAPTLTLLATSRAPLRISGEQEYPLSPLCEEEALLLFAERARLVRPDFALDGERQAVAEICARLDRLPLALELAAARVKLLPPAALLQRLESRLKLLTGGARDLPERQQTMRATIGWSHELLNAEERTVFRRLAVFRGGCSLESAAAVCDPNQELDLFEIVSSLIDNSLLRQRETSQGEPRLQMLETVREYATEQLQHAGEADELVGQHADHYLALAERAYPALRYGGSDQADWFTRFETEHDNLRAALSTYATSGQADSQLRLVAALGRFWILSGRWRDGEQAIQDALAAREDRDSTRVDALMSASAISRYRGDIERSIRLAQEALALAEVLEDDYWLARALTLHAIALSVVGDRSAIPLAEKSLALFKRLGDAWGIALVLDFLGVTALDRRDYAEARRILEQALQSYLLSENRFDAAGALLNLGLISFYLEDLTDARSQFLESLRLGSALKDLVAWNFEGLAAVEAAANDAERAVRLLGSAEAIWHEIGGGLGEAERPMHDAAVDQARAALGESRFAALHAEGRALAFEEALAYARSERSERNDQSTS